MIKNNIYIYEKDYQKLYKYKIDCNFLTFELFQSVNTFLFENSQYKLVHTDSHFTEHIPMIVVNSDEGEIISACEILYNPATNIAEIYNVCVNVSYRRQGQVKELLNFIFYLYEYNKFNLWIAVALNNPMYSIVTRIYINAGFTDNVGLNSITPSGILYSHGFLELYKLIK